MVELPIWAKMLQNYYCALRVSKRNKTLRRKYYRLITKEKFRLACLGINQDHIIIVCRYLSGKMTKCLQLIEPLQLMLDLST